MLAGHLGAALAAKRLDSGLPLAVAVACAFALDLVWPVLLLVGVEVVRVNPGDTAFTNLAFLSYPWTHSLLMVVIWSVLGCFLGRLVSKSWRRGTLLGALILSHWVLDWVTHKPDLPLWPGGPKVGLGLWNSVPGTIAVEAGLFVAGVWLYTKRTKPKDRGGTVSLVALLFLVGAIWLSQPWSPPPPSSTAVALGAMVLWLLVPWASWIDRHRGNTGGSMGAASGPHASTTPA